MLKWNSKKKQQQLEHELQQMQKIRASQERLLEAATLTADAAHEVTFQLKERLDDSLRQIEETSNLLADALIVCSETGVIQSFNPAAELMFGRKASEVYGKTIDLVIRKLGDPDSSSLAILETFSHHKPCAMTATPVDGLRGKRKNGELFLIDGSISHFERSNGLCISMLLIRDVTVPVQMTEDLVTAETKYRSIFEQSFDGIVVAQHHRIVAANPAFGRILGYSNEEIISTPLVEFFHQKDVKTLHDNHADRMQGDDKPKNYTVTGLRSDGTPVEFLVSSTRINWKSEFASLITFKDISEIKKLEDELGHSTAINQVFTKNTVDMFVSYDEHGVITRVNGAYLKHFRLKKDQVIGTNFLGNIPEDARLSYSTMLGDLTVAAPTGRFQLHLDLPNGKTEIQDWIVHAIYDDTGNFIEFQSLGRDLTEIISELRSQA